MILVSVLGFVPMVVQTIAAPESTRAKKDDERLCQRRLPSFNRLMFGMFLLTAVPLIVLGPWAARLLYGAAYVCAALLSWLGMGPFFTIFGLEIFQSKAGGICD